jgi:two-component system response regulator MprA
MTTVLIADDDQTARDALLRTLADDGYTVVTAADGPAALRVAQEQRPDLVILDWRMPDLDGIEVARRLKAADGTPILMVTARDAVEDRVAGLDAGADDYLVKPFAPAELLARLRALLRRGEPAARDDVPLTFLDLRVDPTTREARREDRRFELSPREFDLLAYLLRYPRRVLPRDRILQDVWGYDFAGDENVLEVYVGYLRTKLEAGGEPRLLQTVRGVGYVLREP